MRIFLVRHGESEANVDRSILKSQSDHGVSLTTKGEQDAAEAGKFLKSYYEEQDAFNDGLRKNFGKFGHSIPKVVRPRIWTSPYRRARQTSQIIQDQLGSRVLDHREHVLLAEQQFGLFDGHTNEELKTLYPEESRNYDKCMETNGRFWARLPLGESRFDVAVRVHQAFGTFQRDEQQNGVPELIVVCHGVVMRVFIMMWCRLTPEWLDAQPNPPNGSVYLIRSAVEHGYVFLNPESEKGLE